MPEISLTTFVDFVLASGTPRITCVRRAKSIYSQEYSPAFDFWRKLRIAIIEMHEQEESRTTLDNVLDGLIDAKKRLLYADCIRSYKEWMGRKNFTWSGCTQTMWKRSGLSVRVNPELGIGINGQNHVIKLYFKAESPSKKRLDTMLHLMKSTLSLEERETVPGILDVPRGRLITQTADVSDIEALLIGEGTAFVTMWNLV